MMNVAATYSSSYCQAFVAATPKERMVKNGKAVRFLSNNHPNTLNIFQQIVESTSLER